MRPEEISNSRILTQLVHRNARSWNACAQDRYRPRDAPDKAKFKDWRTYQMSDHLVMWTELTVDKTDDYLKELSKL